MKLADNVRVEPLFACTNIVIPIKNEDRQEAIALWEKLKLDKGKDIEISITNKD